MKYIKIRENIQTLLDALEYDHYLLAISGGADSTLLFHVMADILPLGKMSCAHMDFQQRGVESTRDRTFVQKTCQSRGIPLHVAYWEDIPERGRQGNFQDAARKARYTWMRQIADDLGHCAIVTAHHLQDQLESHLMALARGSGIQGLKGMLSHKDRRLKPLLQCTKEDILRALEERQLDHVEDSSNATTIYRRNAIRNRVIPAMTEIYPDLFKAYAHSVDALQQLWHAIEIESLNTAWSELTSPTTPLEWQLLDWKLRKLGFSEDQLQALRVSMKSSELKTLISSDAQIQISRGKIFVFESPIVKPDSIDITLEPGQYTLAHSKNLEIKLSSAEIRPSDKSEILLPHRYLGRKCVIREPELSERIELFGSPGRHKKVQDILTDLKLDPISRKQILGLYFEDQLLWLLGYKVSEKTRVSSPKTKYLQLRVF